MGCRAKGGDSLQALAEFSPGVRDILQMDDWDHLLQRASGVNSRVLRAIVCKIVNAITVLHCACMENADPWRLRASGS